MLFRSINETVYYDSDAAYRNQSIYGGAPIYQQPSGYVPPSVDAGYVPPSVNGYQPPNPATEAKPAEVGYRPPLFPGSAELAEVAPEPVTEEAKKESGAVVLRRSLQTMANALRKVQERAMQSAQARHTETEEERSIKALFTERIVKGRPDLFSPTAESPSHASPVPEGRLSDHLRDFNKRFGRSDAKYLRDAVTTFCDETRRMYQSQYPSDYTPTPPASPLLPPISGASPAEVPRQRLEDRLHSFTDALMAEIKKHKAWRGADEATLRNTRDCVEKLLVEQLRALTLGAVRKEMEKEDRELEEKMGYLQFLTPENLDVATICREHMEIMDEVMRQLQEMTGVVAPAEKLECIITACRTLGALLQKGGKNDAGADDFLPAFIYVVLKSRIPKLPSTVEYISRYRHPDELLSEGGYCLTNLSGAVSFLQNCGGCDFDIDPDLFEREYHKTAPAPVVDENEEDLLQF